VLKLTVLFIFYPPSLMWKWEIWKIGNLICCYKVLFPIQSIRLFWHHGLHPITIQVHPQVGHVCFSGGVFVGYGEGAVWVLTFWKDWSNIKYQTTAITGDDGAVLLLPVLCWGVVEAEGLRGHSGDRVCGVDHPEEEERYEDDIRWKGTCGDC